MEQSNDIYVENGNEPQDNSLNYTPSFGAAIGSALAYFFSMLAFILFICPYAFWNGATMRLYKACKSKSLKTFIHSSRWPFLSYCKKVFFEFFIDGMMFISYFVGSLIALVALCMGEPGVCFIILVSTYYSPIFFSWMRDLFTLCLLPFQKFLSWVSKPAQQIDVDFHNR